MAGRAARIAALSAVMLTAACATQASGASVDPPSTTAPAAAELRTAQKADVSTSVPTPSEVLPWMAAIVPVADGPTAEDPECSGSVLTSRWVLTAGHCQPTATGSDVQVAVITGRRDLTRTSVGQYLQVDRAVQMPGWAQQGVAYSNDYTLLHLASPTTSATVRIASPGMVAALGTGARVRAAGWGALTPDGDPVKVVHSTKLERLPDAVCAQEYGSLYDDSTQLCGGWKWPSMDHDTCNGDSGGPLALKVDGAIVEVGLTSWGSTCLTEGVPGVYADVGSAYDWITSVIANG